MKINWFSPLQPAKTEIAGATLRVLPALAKRAVVTLWTDESEWDKRFTEFAEIRSFDPADPPFDELRGGPCFYNIGNDQRYHTSIWQISQKVPGIVVLHDVSLHDMFSQLYTREWRDVEAYITQMEIYHGR